jgi:hypothetical protein
MPVVFSWIIGFASDKNAQWWEGVLYVALVVSVLTVRVITHVRFYYTSVRVGMNVCAPFRPLPSLQLITN